MRGGGGGCQMGGPWESLPLSGLNHRAGEQQCQQDCAPPSHSSAERHRKSSALLDDSWWEAAPVLRLSSLRFAVHSPSLAYSPAPKPLMHPCPASSAPTSRPPLPPSLCEDGGRTYLNWLSVWSLCLYWSCHLHQAQGSKHCLARPHLGLDPNDHHVYGSNDDPASPPAVSRDRREVGLLPCQPWSLPHQPHQPSCGHLISGLCVIS